MIASARDPVGNLPGYEFDHSSGLYMVAEDATNGVNKTRALKPKTTDEVRTSE